MEEKTERELLEVLGEDVPVVMPELPATLQINTAQQFKAIGDSTRTRILDIIKHTPATAKQIADQLGIPPGTVGHHLQVLEAAGMAQVVARRLVRGIVAKYYTRTARLFLFDFPPEVKDGSSEALDFLTEARAQLADTIVAGNDGIFDGEPFCQAGFPHTRLSRQRAEEFERRLFDLVYEFATEPPDPTGDVYGLCMAFFVAPPYLQNHPSPATTIPTTTESETKEREEID
jgi:DNA-binding transcriptional ArsR family regulator